MSTLRLFAMIALVALLFPALAPAQAQPQGWKLVWADEFDSPGPSGLPDPAKWDYEDGFVRNGEAQYYTRARAENARVENGMLVIEARREKFPNPRYNPAATRGPATRPAAEYTSASLHTLKKVDWLYGRVEVRAKIPQGKGTWPAIWMMGANRPQVGWPRCGEIDIMEFVGHTPDQIHATVHFTKDGKHASSGNRVKVDQPFADFHIYALEWFPDHMDFYFDQQKYHTFALDKADQAPGAPGTPGTPSAPATSAGGVENPFRKPQYLILNLALGGSWGKEIDDANLPQKMLVDYVRVYQREAPAAAK